MKTVTLNKRIKMNIHKCRGEPFVGRKFSKKEDSLKSGHSFSQIQIIFATSAQKRFAIYSKVQFLQCQSTWLIITINAIFALKVSLFTSIMTVPTKDTE